MPTTDSVQPLTPFITGDRAVSRATRRMFRLVPTTPPRPGTVEHADMRTSVDDARIALSIASGWSTEEMDRCSGRVPHRGAPDQIRNWRESPNR